VAELREGRVQVREITPEQFGFTRTNLDGIKVQNSEDSLKILHAVLGDTPGPARDTVLLNAGAAIYVAGLAPDHATGIALAREALKHGAARAKLDQLVALTRTFAAEAH
jgi:anthranilate phosphoribosyltransferase